MKNNYVAVEVPGPTTSFNEINPPCDKPKLTKERYVGLSKIASELVDWLKEKGVTRSEGCFVRQITEQMWNL